jgi:hypothetical protein
VSAELLIALVALGVLVYIASAFRGPREKSFTCRRCRRVAPHTQRTISVWRRGNRNIFCDSCHRQWLGRRQTVGARGGGSGCFVGLALITTPIVLMGTLLYLT